jgi:hypothetical protein
MASGSHFCPWMALPATTASYPETSLISVIGRTSTAAPLCARVWLMASATPRVEPAWLA